MAQGPISLDMIQVQNKRLPLLSRAYIEGERKEKGKKDHYRDLRYVVIIIIIIHYLHWLEALVMDHKSPYIRHYTNTGQKDSLALGEAVACLASCFQGCQASRIIPQDRALCGALDNCSLAAVCSSLLLRCL